MASRVNFKFVATLLAVLILVFSGVAATAYVVLKKSATEYIKLGDQAVQDEDFRLAAQMYGRAVNKEQGNVEYLIKFRDALGKKVPPNRTAFADDYTRFWRGSLRQIAELSRTDIQAHEDHLGHLYREYQFSGFNRQAWEDLMNRASAAIRNFELIPQPTDEWEVLRRYRGLAAVRILLANLDLQNEERDLAREDLERVLEVDPDDSEAAVGLVQWHFTSAQRARSQRRNDEATSHMKEARDVLSDFLASHPNDPRASLASVQMKIDETDFALDQSLFGAARLGALRTALGSLVPDLEQLDAALAVAPPDEVDILIVDSFRRACLMIEQDNSQDRALVLVDRLLESRPEDPGLLQLKARIASDRGETEQAIALYQRIVDTEMKPIGLEGWRLFAYKQGALYEQANATLTMWENAEESNRDELLERAQGFRQELARRLPDRSPQLLLLDSKIKLAENDLTTAQRLLLDFNEQTDSQNPEGVRLLAQVSQGLGNLTYARQQFERLSEIQPNNVGALLALGRVNASLEKTEDAIDAYSKALQIDPQNETAGAQLSVLQAIAGQGPAQDPVVEALIRAQRLIDGVDGQPDEDGAIALLEQALVATNYDFRVLISVVRLKVARNDRPGALLAVKDARVAHPENADLRSLELQLEAEDPVQVGEQLIAESETTDFEKHLARYNLYRQHGLTDQSLESLAAAAAIDERDARVVDYRFMAALQAKDYDEAQRQVELATTHAIDQADGLTFVARLQIARDQWNEALTTLQGATSVAPLNPFVFRILASVQMRLGRTTEAVVSFQRAMEIRGNDIPTVTAYIRALASMQRYSEALEVARQSSELGKTNRDFVRVWMQLEGEHGDKQAAISRRELLYQRAPDDVDNAASLAGLYMDVRRWSDAKRLIDGLRAKGDSLQYALLEARWHADQGDTDAARRTFVGYIVDTRDREGEITAQPYLAFGNFMIERGQMRVGLAAFDQAREYQKPDVMEADRFKGDVMFRMQRYTEAHEAFKRVIDAGADPEFTITKRAAEALIRLNQIDEAAALLDTLGPDQESDLQAVLLRSDVALAKGDARRARELLDRAISSYPTNPLGYVKRAQANLGDAAMAQDVLADLDSAIRINPAYWQAFQIRAGVHLRDNRLDDGFSDFRAALRVNPNLDEIRYALINELLSRDRDDEALDVAEEGVQQRPTDILLMLNLGEIFSRVTMWDRASRFYELAWIQSKLLPWDDSRSNAVAQRYVTSLLRTTPPALRTAQGVLATPELKTSESPPNLLLRARLQHLRGNRDAGHRDLVAAFAILQSTPNRLPAWLGAVIDIYRDDVEVMTALDVLEQNVGTNPWIGLYRATLMAGRPDSASEGLAMLDAVAASAGDDLSLMLEVHKRRSAVLYTQGQIREASDAMKAGLAINPDDVELNNNLAYALAEDLDSPAEGLPYAKHAAELMPGRATILDTLGWVELLTGELEAAQRTLQQALTLATGEADTATIRIHLAHAKLANNDRTGALELANKVQAALTSNAALRQSHQTDLDELMERINAS